MRANGDVLMMFFTFLSVSECKLMFPNFRGEEERLSFYVGVNLSLPYNTHAHTRYLMTKYFRPMVKTRQ